MNARKAWWLYSTVRIGLFAAAFAVVWWLGARWWLAAVLAALISMAVSIIALDPLRRHASEGLYEWQNRKHNADALHEDDVVDGENLDGNSAESETLDGETLNGETSR